MYEGVTDYDERPQQFRGETIRKVPLCQRWMPGLVCSMPMIP